MKFNLAKTILFFALPCYAIADDICFQNKTSDASNKAYLADVVFIGKMLSKYTASEGSLLNSTNIYMANFSVEKILKPNLTAFNTSNRSVRIGETVIVGNFSKSCEIYPSPPRSYAVFLKDQRDAGQLWSRVSALPELASKMVRRRIRKIVCDKCAKIPVVEISSNIGEKDQLNYGKRISLKCRIKSGNPAPSISWFKDSYPIKEDERISIRQQRKSSRLKIEGARPDDNGIYECRASNPAGKVSEFFNQVIVESDENSHEVLCAEQSYCLNGGVCYYFKTLGTQFCRCNLNFMGPRCEYRNLFDVLEEYKQRREHRVDRTMTITGLVLTGVVLIIICIVAWFMARRRRQQFYKKREMKEKFKRELESAVKEAKARARPVPMTYKAGAPITRTMVEAMTLKAPKSVVTQTDTQWLLSQLEPSCYSLDQVSVEGSAHQPYHPSQGRIRLPGTSSMSAVQANHKGSPPPNQSVVAAIVETTHSPPRVDSSSLLRKSSTTSRGSIHGGYVAPLPPGVPPPPAYNDIDQCSDYDNAPASDMEVQLHSEVDLVGLATEEPQNNHNQSNLRHRHKSSSSDSSECRSDSSGPAEEHALFERLTSKPRVNSMSENQKLMSDYKGKRNDGQIQTSIVPPWEDFNNHIFSTPNNYAFNTYAMQDDILDNRSGRYFDTKSLDRESII